MSWERAPLAPPPLREEEVHIFRATLRRDEAQAFRDRALLDEPERTRADRFLDPSVATSWSAARAATRQVLSYILSTRPGDLRFEQGTHGKPHLAASEGFPDTRALRFNLSHGGDWALIAVTQTHEVGVDVEQRRDRDTWDSLARYAFSNAEFGAWATLDASARPAAFYALWTRKEAYIKALGMGLHLDLKSFDVSASPDHARVIAARHARAAEPISMETFLVDARHQGAIALCHHRIARVRYWDWAGVS